MTGRIQLDHIAIAIPRLADAAAVLAGDLGGVPAFGAASRAFTFGQWRFAGGGRIEVLEPRGADGFLHRFLAQRGSGIHHVTFRVPSLRRVCEHAEAHGYTIVGYDDSDPSWSEAFFHPKQALGIVVQLAESRLSGEPSSRQAPPRPPDPLATRRSHRVRPPAVPAQSDSGGGSEGAVAPEARLWGAPFEARAPVTILGLRLRVRSRERARTQWEAVLEGQGREDHAGALVYRWPRSPLRLIVEIDPNADEGPLAIEIASDRVVGLSAGPHPVLGAVFAQRPLTVGSSKAGR